MSRREDVDNAIWSDEDFLDLSSDAKLLYLWSFTNPACGMAGIYRAPKRLAAFQTGIPPARLEKASKELAECRFVFWDDGVIWVRTRVRYLHTKTVQIGKAIARDLESIPERSALKAGFLSEYGDLGWLEPHLSRKGNVVNLTRTSPEVQGRVS